MDYGKVSIPGNAPSKANCYKVITIGGHGSLAKSAALKAYENQFYITLPASYRNLGIDCFFEFYVDVYYPSLRSDLDNSLKCLLDCLQHTNTIKNDNKCVKIVAQKFVDKVNPRVDFRIVTVE